MAERIRSNVRWKRGIGRRMSATPEGAHGWLLDPLHGDVPSKNELLIVSSGLSERWGLPKMDPALREELFGDQSEPQEPAVGDIGEN